MNFMELFLYIMEIKKSIFKTQVNPSNGSFEGDIFTK
jgi:hypothetical protein